MFSIWLCVFNCFTVYALLHFFFLHIFRYLCAYIVEQYYKYVHMNVCVLTQLRLEKVFACFFPPNIFVYPTIVPFLLCTERNIELSPLQLLKHSYINTWYVCVNVCTIEYMYAQSFLVSMSIFLLLC